MRISDWSSDVCSYDLNVVCLCCVFWGDGFRTVKSLRQSSQKACSHGCKLQIRLFPNDAVQAQTKSHPLCARTCTSKLDRKSVVSGKRGSVRVDLGGRRIIKKKIRKLV